MLLTVDIGNTHLRLAVFRALTDAAAPSDAAPWHEQSFDSKMPDLIQYLTLSLTQPFFEKISGSIIVSVVPYLNDLVRNTIHSALGILPLVLTHQTPMGLLNGYFLPDEVGLDRLVTLVGAQTLCQPPLIVADLGTVVTIDCLASPITTPLPLFLGGAILPGAMMTLQSLTANAERLKYLASELTSSKMLVPHSVIGQSTKECILSGLYYGWAEGIFSVIEHSRQMMKSPHCPIILTGGDAAYIMNIFKTKTSILHVPGLIHLGLRQIYQMNQK